MTDVELIRGMREKAAVEGPGSLERLLTAAADRLEELSERVDIMSVENEAGHA